MYVKFNIVNIKIIGKNFIAKEIAKPQSIDSQ